METIKVPQRSTVLVQATDSVLVGDYARLEAFTITTCSSNEYTKVLQPKVYTVDETIYSNGVKSKWIKGDVLQLTVEHRIANETEFKPKDGDVEKHTKTRDAVVEIFAVSSLQWLCMEDSICLSEKLNDRITKSISDSESRAIRLAAFE